MLPGAGDDPMADFYSDAFQEWVRLERGRGLLELRRTQELLEHLLPPAPSVVVDVGGGPGRYAQWMATSGYSVTLIDPVPALVQFAREQALHGSHSFNAVIGDARSLELDDESVDAVVMMGPLYHLPGAAERQRALDEGFRVLRPGGTLLAAAISRFTALLDTARVGALDVARAARAHNTFLQDGRFDGQTGFTRSYFHRPDELAEELGSAGLTSVQVHGVEGPLWPLLPAAEEATDDDRTQLLLESAINCAREIGKEPSVLGVSGHMLAVGRRPA